MPPTFFFYGLGEVGLTWDNLYGRMEIVAIAFESWRRCPSKMVLGAARLQGSQPKSCTHEAHLTNALLPFFMHTGIPGFGTQRQESSPLTPEGKISVALQKRNFTLVPLNRGRRRSDELYGLGALVGS